MIKTSKILSLLNQNKGFELLSHDQHPFFFFFFFLYFLHLTEKSFISNSCGTLELGCWGTSWIISYNSSPLRF